LLIGQQVDRSFDNMLLAPDGKIYIGGADSISYHIIHEPDSLGLACDFEQGGLVFPLAYPNPWFPYFPNYRLGALEGSECDSIVSGNENVIPGKANKLLALFADKVAISFSQTKEYLNTKNLVLTGCPSHIPQNTLNRDEIIKSFGLDSGRKTLLAMGGSQGSTRINQEFFSLVQSFDQGEDFQVIHITGNSDYDKF